MVDLDVAYIPTPKDIVRKMLQLANVRRDELVFDLGAGDGRVLVEAVRKFGARAIGIELDPERFDRISKRLKATGIVAELIQGDFMKVDISSADVVAMYLSPFVNCKLAPKFKEELKTGARIVSLDYELPGWSPEREISVTSGGVRRNIYLYRVTDNNRNSNA